MFSVTFISSNIFACDKPITLSKPTGEYSVGYKFIELTDETRQDPYDQDHKRKLKVTLYYPSQGDKKVESYGVEEKTFWSRELTEPLKEGEIKQEEFDSIESDFNRLVSFKSYEATPVKGNFPTIIFEHGYGVTAGSYQYLILDLVSHGYVVISPAHPYIADTVMFSDGSKSFLKAERDAELFDTAFQDAEFLLSKIDDIAKQVESADISKLGIIGHSLGATTSIKLARKSPLIKAGISLDPLINHITYEYDGDERIESKVDDKIQLDNGSNLGKPFLHVFAEKYMCDPSKLTLSKNNYKAVVKGTEHNSFADHAVLKEEIGVFSENGWNLGAGDAPSSDYREELNVLFRSFCDNYLKEADVELSGLSSDNIILESSPSLDF